MRTRVTPFLALALLSAAMLSGCGLIQTGPPRIDADDIADTAEDVLQDEFDTRFKVDCGDDDVKLVKDEDLDCLATNRDTDLEYDLAVTITKVKVPKYEIEVELADTANNADDVDPSDEESDEPDDSTGATVSGTDFADVVVDALDDVLGYAPTDMECLSDEVEIYEDNVEYCFFTDEDDEERTVEATISSFDESSGAYEILAEVVG